MRQSGRAFDLESREKVADSAVKILDKGVDTLTVLGIEDIGLNEMPGTSPDLTLLIRRDHSYTDN